MILQEQRDWQAAMEDASAVMELVHEAVRQDNFDMAAIQAGLEQASRSFYNDELTLMAATQDRKSVV